MMKLKRSPEFSLKGFNLKKWVAGNYDSIKIVVGAIVALSVSNPELFPVSLTVGAGAIVVKAVLDVAHFWHNEVEL